MHNTWQSYLKIQSTPRLDHATLILAFSGWMDGGDVSTGTANRLIDGLNAKPFASIDRDPFYIFNFPGTMELAALFRPHAEIDGGLLKRVELPDNTFYCHSPSNLVLFVGKEPNLHWHTFAKCILQAAKKTGVGRILFVGSYGGTVPHTREPRVFVTCSNRKLLPEMEQYGVRRTGYAGPGSFVTFLLSEVAQWDMEMVSLVAEIPSYLQGTNPLSIEAMLRRLAKILQLPLDLDALRSASTRWELEVTQAIEQDEELSATVKQLEEAYDNELLDMHAEEGGGG